MKTTFEIPDKKSHSFPLLARSRCSYDENLIILFTSDCRGVVLSDVEDSSMLGKERNWTSCFDNVLWEIIPEATITFRS